MITRNPYGLRFALLLLALLLFGSCVEDRAASGPLVDLVPEEALAALVVEKPARLYASLEAFWAGAKLEESLGSRFSDLFAALGPAAAAIEPLLDTARPLALALLPGLEGGSSPRPVFYLPFKGREDKIREAFAGQGSILALAKGYIVVSTEAGQLQFPPSRAADLSSLKRYPSAALKFWASPTIFEALGKKPGFESVKEGVQGFVSGPEGEEPNELAAFAKLGKELLAELASFDAALIPSRQGLEFRFGAGAKAGGPVEAFLAKAAGGPSALDWASKVRSDSLYAYSYALDPQLGSELGAAYMRLLFELLGSQPEFASFGKSISGFERLMKRWALATGERGAFDFDLDLDPELFKELAAGGEPDGDKAMELLGKAMKFRLAMTQELRDEAAYRELLDNYANDPDLLAFMDDFAAKTGMRTRILREDKRLGGFAYGEYGFDFEILDPAKFGGDAAALGSVNALMEMFRLRYAVGRGQVVMTTEEASVLRDLAESASRPDSLAADPLFKAFADGLPASVQLLGSFSTRRLVALIAPFMPAGAGPALDPERFGAWYSYLAARPRNSGGAAGLETGLSIPASDIGAMVEYGAALKAATATPTALGL